MNKRLVVLFLVMYIGLDHTIQEQTSHRFGFEIILLRVVMVPDRNVLVRALHFKDLAFVLVDRHDLSRLKLGWRASHSRHQSGNSRIFVLGLDGRGYYCGTQR
jgi:hypothetical protein